MLRSFPGAGRVLKMFMAIRYLFSPGGSVKGCKVLVKSFKIGYFSYLVADREGFEPSSPG